MSVRGGESGHRCGQPLTVHPLDVVVPVEVPAAVLAWCHACLVDPGPVGVDSPDGYRQPSRGTGDAAQAGLNMYRAARSGLVEFVHAALEDGRDVAWIARESGVSRQGVAKLVEREGLTGLVQGD